MSDNTPRLALPELVSMQELNCVTWNEALVQLDALVDLYLLGRFIDIPPSSPSDGDAYLVGGSPTGAWSGYAYKIAYCIDGGWRFYTPFNGLRAFVASSYTVIVYLNGTWTDCNSLVNAAEASIASAATCDLGAAGSLFVQITGTTAIASFGTGTNKLRFVRFVGALTLTHNATSLILLGGVSRTTAAGDVGAYASDASGNWREHNYFRAASNPGDYATKTGTETLANKTLSSPAFSGTATGFKSTGFTDNAAATGLVLDSSSRVIFGPGGTTAEGFVTYKSSTPLNDRISVFTNGYDCNLFFYLTAQGAGTPASGIGVGTSTPFLFCGPYGGEFARFDTSMNFMPGNDNVRTLGTAAKRWSTGYAGTAWVIGSGAETKTNVRAFSEAEMAVAKTLAANIRVYQLCDAVAKKGMDAARLHAGMIAEDVFATFAAHGLDPFRYGPCCRDPAVKTVTKTQTISRPKMQTVAVTREVITAANGVATLTTLSETREEPVQKSYPLVDADGAPILDPATGKQYIYVEAVMEAVEETYTDTEPDLDETGAQKWTLGLRYTELTQFVMAGLAARLAVLEAK